jgi:hypothetical protein
MITVNQTTMLLLYLGFFLFFSLGAWVSSHLKSCKKEPLPPLYQLSMCEYCAFEYLATTGKQITQCPQCHSYNKNLTDRGSI